MLNFHYQEIKLLKKLAQTALAKSTHASRFAERNP